MSNNKQTAVEWLIEKLDSNLDINHSWRTRQYIEQAKEMEKQQIMMAVKDSWYMAKGSNFQEPQEEQYYNEEYGGNK